MYKSYTLKIVDSEKKQIIPFLCFFEKYQLKQFSLHHIDTTKFLSKILYIGRNKRPYRNISSIKER